MDLARIHSYFLRTSSMFEEENLMINMDGLALGYDLLNNHSVYVESKSAYKAN